MREVGVVTSGARTSSAPILIYKEAEKFVREEALVVIRDTKYRKEYLGVFRYATKYDPLLTHAQRSAIIEKPELAEESLDLPYEALVARVLGELVGGKLEPPKTPPTPRSKVYLVETPQDINVDLGTGFSVGVHRYSGLEIPLKPSALKYHIAVVGSTGTGKSRLVKAIVEEVLAKTDWSVIVFDHTGMDYAPYWPQLVVKAHEIVLDVETIKDGFAKLMTPIESHVDNYVPPALAYYVACIGIFEKSTLQRELQRNFSELCVQRASIDAVSKFLSGVSAKTLEEFILRVSRGNMWRTDDLALLFKKISEELGAREPTPTKLWLYTKIYADHYIKRLNSMKFKVDDLVDMSRKNRLVIIDLSTVETEFRRVIVKRALERLWEIVEEELKPINTLVVVDEAHNYACEKGCYPASAMIEKTLREGRKWGIGVVLASQRVVDFTPDVRNNVNTVFFSKLQTPYDFKQLEGFVDLAGITMETLSLLETREFFFAGLGNPLKYPMLITVRDVGEPTR